MKRKNICLYGGLTLLVLAGACRWAALPPCLVWVFFGLAILFKTVFLTLALREKGFKPQPWLCLILAGVGLIFFSLLFKTIIPLPLVRKTLFCAAIVLKTGGLALMLLSRGKTDGGTEAH